jgi:hypothetical protein
MDPSENTSNVTGVEGDWDGDVVIIGFPDRDAAEAWYHSPAYQEILRCAPSTPAPWRPSSTAASRRDTVRSTRSRS